MPTLARRKPPVHRSGKRALSLARQIVSDIDRRGDRAGDHLPPEHTMLTKYGVARGTLREALRYLELQGIIHLRTGPGGGPIIQQPKPKDFASTMALVLQFLGATFRSILELRQAVSPAMASLAAERASSDDIRKLEEALAHVEEAKTDQEFGEQSRWLHDAIAWASGNPMMWYMSASLHHITTASEIALSFTREERDFQIKSYCRVIAAIKDRDPERSFAEMAHFYASPMFQKERFSKDMARPVRWHHADAPAAAEAGKKKRAS